MKKIIIERFSKGHYLEDTNTTSFSASKDEDQKWRMKEREGGDGWKLKDVRRTKLKPESLDGAEILKELYNTNFDASFNDRFWRVEDIYLIENDKINSRFEEFKREHINQGRTSDDMKETLVFSAESEKACKDICQEGYKVSSKKRHVLGYTGSGVHLVRHYDILTRYLMFQQYNSPTYIMVYKTFLGKMKPIVPRLHKDDNYVNPYVGFDSHVSARRVDRNMPICEALNCSYVYLYDFDPVASNPVKYPRQILPYAIIQLEKKIPCLPENPFLAVGCDESRSTWEVKGETRRGFRFMFTKSGLKGKHKVFSKALTREKFESHLKGQLLEMRTKTKNTVGEAKRPEFKKTDDSESNSDQTTDANKQSVAQECADEDSDKLCTAACLNIGPEYENLVISKHIRDTFKLCNFKPSVKLKRLDQKFRRKSKSKTKMKEMKIGTDKSVSDPISSSLVSSSPGVSNHILGTSISSTETHSPKDSKESSSPSIDTSNDPKRAHRIDVRKLDMPNADIDTVDHNQRGTEIKVSRTQGNDNIENKNPIEKESITCDGGVKCDTTLEKCDSTKVKVTRDTKNSNIRPTPCNKTDKSDTNKYPTIVPLTKETQEVAKQYFTKTERKKVAKSSSVKDDTTSQKCDNTKVTTSNDSVNQRIGSTHCDKTNIKSANKYQTVVPNAKDTPEATRKSSTKRERKETAKSSSVKSDTTSQKSDISKEATANDNINQRIGSIPCSKINIKETKKVSKQTLTKTEKKEIAKSSSIKGDTTRQNFDNSKEKTKSSEKRHAIDKRKDNSYKKQSSDFRKSSGSSEHAKAKNNMPNTQSTMDAHKIFQGELKRPDSNTNSNLKVNCLSEVTDSRSDVKKVNTTFSSDSLEILSKSKISSDSLEILSKSKKVKESLPDNNKIWNGQEKQKENNLRDKERKTNKLSERFSATKTQFGRVVHTVKKDTTGTRKDLYSDRKDSDIFKSKRDSIGNEFSFSSQSFDKDPKLVKMYSKCDQFKHRKHTERTGDRKKEKSKLSSSIDLSSSVRKSGTVSNDSSRAGTGQFRSHKKDPITDKDCKLLVSSDNCKAQVVAVVKSKSPEIATAAPDILNSNPVLIAAKTSTSPQLNAEITDGNGPLKKDKSCKKPDKNLFDFKNSYFYSEMSVLKKATETNSINHLKPVGEQVPKSIIPNHLASFETSLGKNDSDQTNRGDRADQIKAGGSKTDVDSLVNIQLDHQYNAKNHENCSGNADKITTESDKQLFRNLNVVNTSRAIPELTTMSSIDCNSHSAFHTPAKQSQSQNANENSSNHLDKNLSESGTRSKVSSLVTTKDLETKKLCEENSSRKENIKSKSTDSENQQCNQQTSISLVSLKVSDAKTHVTFQDTNLKNVSESKSVVPTQPKPHAEKRKKSHQSEINELGDLHKKAKKTHSATKSDRSKDDVKSTTRSSSTHSIEKERYAPPVSKIKSKYLEVISDLACSGKQNDTVQCLKDTNSNNKNTTIQQVMCGIPTTCFDEENLCSKKNKRRPQSHKCEFVRHMKIDETTADRLRSFLGTTAAVAMQRGKTENQKDNISTEAKLKNEADKSVETKSPINGYMANDKSERSKNQTSIEDKAPTSLVEVKLLQDTSKSSSCHNSSNESNTCTPSKQAGLSRLKPNRRDSLDVHDHDSQDTIIGGVTHLTNSPARPAFPDSNSQDSTLKQFESLLTELNQNQSPTSTLTLKQEKVDEEIEKIEDDKKEEMPNFETLTTGVENVDTEESSALKSTSHSDSLPMAASCNIKQEPIESTSDENTQSNLENNIESATIFPHTKREPAKRAPMLNATDSKNVIVDTLKELSNILKFLNDNNVSESKSTEKVAQIASEMCNILTDEQRAATIPSFSQSQCPNASMITYDPYIDAHVKTEPVETCSFDTHQVVKQEDAAVCQDNHHTTEENNYSKDELRKNYDYEYILKSSDDEHQSASEIHTSNAPLETVIETQETNCPLESDNVDKTNDIAKVNKTENDSSTLAVKNERDELPQLFDPSEGVDITSLEVFGIQLEMRVDRKRAKRMLDAINPNDAVTEDMHPTTDMHIHKEQSEKIVIEENTAVSPLKLKLKSQREFKTGLLNKGVKERKNMFDLKINRSRQKLEKHMHERKVQKLVRTKADNSSTEPDIENQPQIIKLERNTLEDQGENLKDKVYKNVCEKLSTLKKRTVSEGIDSDVNISQKTANCERPISVEEEDSVKQGKDTVYISNGKKKAEDTKKSERGKTQSFKKHAIIPFQTVIHLKRKQFKRFIRGEAKSKFINYKYVSPKLYKETIVRKPSSTRSRGSKEMSIDFDKKIKSKTTTSNVKDSNGIVANAEEENLSGESIGAEGKQIEKSMKMSSGDSDKETSTSRRSRSKSSHRSSETGRHNSREHSSQFHNAGHKPFNFSGKTFQFNSRPPFRKFFNKYTHNFQSFQRPYQKYVQYGKPSFNKFGTGYFSWRRKYQPRRNMYDGKADPEKTTSEFAYWKRFKERETLRIQIENAVKDYRRTFEQTPDDVKGDEKVASYLSFLTDKLNKIQTKRDKLHVPFYTHANNEHHDRNRSHHRSPERDVHDKRASSQWEKLEQAQNFLHHETRQQSSVYNLSEAIATDNVSPSFQQRRHASGIEDLLKEHISKHCEHLTKQIKQELSKELKDRNTREQSPAYKSKRRDDRERDERSGYGYDKGYERRRSSEDRYRRHSRERSEHNRPGQEDASRSHENYEARGYKYTDQHYRDYNDKHSRDTYQHGNPNYRYSSNSDTSHQHVYKKRFEPYQKFHKDTFQHRRQFTKPYTDFRDKRFTGIRNYFKNYSEHSGYKRHYDKYRPFNRDNRTGYKHQGNYSEGHSSETSRSQDKSHHTKSKEHHKDGHVSYEKNDQDEHFDIGNVKDEFDATKYRQPNAIDNKRGKYIPYFQKVRNPPTFYKYNSKNEEDDNKNPKTQEKRKANIPTTSRK